MNNISRIALHRRGILLGLAAGAGLAAIALGMGDARADNDTTEPAALLSTAAADLSSLGQITPYPPRCSSCSIPKLSCPRPMSI